MTTKPLTPAVAYIRMSSDRQEASPKQQRGEVANLAKREGCCLIREYYDEAISGDATHKRKAFQQMIRDAEELGDFAVILCWDQDRFGRFDSIEAGRWIYPLRQAAVSLVTVAQGRIDWNDFTGRVMYGIIQEGKHQFLVDLSRNVLRGRIASAKAGRMIVTPPYGYDRLLIDPAGKESRRVPGGEKAQRPKGWNGRLVPSQNPAEVDTIRWLFETFANTDCSLHSLVQALNRQRIPPRRGKGWSATALQYLLTNPVYIGQLVFGRRVGGKYHQMADNGDLCKAKPRAAYRNPPIVLEDVHEPLVSRETFDRVQEKLAARRRGNARPRYNGYILNGVLRCGHCGRPMSGRSAGAGRGRRYYTCPGGKTGQCKGYTVRQDYLDNYALDQLEKRLLSPEAVDAITRAIHRQAKAGTAFQTPTKALRGQLAALEQKITKGSENLLLADAEHVRELSAMLGGWKGERAELQDRLEALAVNAGGSTAEERAARAVQELGKVRQHFASGNPVKVRAVVKSMVEEIRLWWEPRGRRYRRVARGVLTFRNGGLLASTPSTADQKPIVFTEADLGPQRQYERAAALVVLLYENRPVSTRQIAEQLGCRLDSGNVTMALTRAERDGLPVRRVSRSGWQKVEEVL